MGSVIDTERKDDIYRCNYVKIGIIYINLIGTPISFFCLIICIIRMIYFKKRIMFLTRLIILIFLSEIVNTISKMIQLLKYCFDDSRKNEVYDPNSPRSIICQIQIVTSIFSDFCSLLSTLLLSLRCYDVIKNKKGFFDKGKNGTLSIISVIIISVILSISILFIDRALTLENDSYRYDVRDRCSYWCWVDHITSLICFVLYFFILFFNICFACKTIGYLKSGYRKLLEENNMNTPLNDMDKDNKSKSISSNFTKEEIKRIEELKLMRIKCLIYPIITIVIWSFAIIYRVVDDSIFMSIDKEDNKESSIEKEQKFLTDYPFLRIMIQLFLIIHTFISSVRGIFYAISFIVFEEKVFNNIFRRFWKKCFKEEYSELDENEDEKKRTINNSSYNCDIEESKNNDSERDSKVEKENDNKSEAMEMNTSDYHYNEDI